ncbi:lipoprotein LppH [Mycolicibacterium mageritense DSM 44476 = CIP 104973]|uniref:sensor domain-containing protein n=1 Tax=Mycolicibacterium mageritense TaxID=53462 RepID=UPI001E448C31|nr:sensor domain-containing protein [Mycolicibacterium mageritense]MCC9185568.1 sensor domain-containing protein [Mycolicibacterium mageritense]
MRKTLTVCVAICAVTVVAGCSATVQGQAVPEAGSAQVARQVDGLVLSAAEVNAAMGATDMVFGTSRSSFVDNSDQTSPQCLEVSNMGQDKVYANTGWVAVHIQGVREPVDHFQHLAHQAVVSFPHAADADKFMVSSARAFLGCANQRYTYRGENGDPDTIWNVGQAVNTDGVLAISSTEQNGDGWTCQRGLAAARNIVADILTCSTNPTDSPAVTIARDIADKVTGQ